MYLNNEEEIKKIQNKFIYEGNDTVYNHLSNTGKDKLNTLCKEESLNLDDFKKEKIWSICSNLLYTAMNRSGFQNTGVDAYFIKKATGNQKILELESFEKQISINDSIPDSEMERH